MSNWYSYGVGLGLGLSLLAVSPVALAQPAESLPALSEQPALIKQGYERLAQGAAAAALARFEQAVQRYPSSGLAHQGLGDAYWQLGRYDQAYIAYRRTVELMPNNVAALTALGQLGAFRAEWREAGIEALTTLLTVEPGAETQTDELALARSQRGLLLFYSGRLGEAVADYEIALAQLDAPDPNVVIGAAQVFAYGGRTARSLELFEQYLAAGETLTIYEVQAYAHALRAAGSVGQAVAELEPFLASELTPEQVSLRGALAVAYAAAGEPQRGLDLVNSLAADSLVAARALNEMTRYSDDASLRQRAAAAYGRVLTRSDLSVGQAREVADALSAYAAEQATSLDLYRQLSERYPNDVSLYVQTSLWERQLAQISAGELRQRLLTLSLPEQATQLEYIARTLARLDPPDGQLLPFYQAVLAATRVEPFLHYRVAQIYLGRNLLEEAEAAVARYGNSADPAVQLLLAELERRRGNLTASAELYQGMIDAPDSSSAVLTGALQGLAGIRQGQGRYQEALALYDRAVALNPGNDAKILGQTSLAYQAEAVTQAEAEALLNQWLANYPLTNNPPELYSLAGALPPAAARSDLYRALLEANPEALLIRQRQLQVLADRDPEAALAAVAELVAANPQRPEGYLLQGQIAQDVGELSTAAQAYGTLLERDPEQLEALVGLAGVRFQQQRYQEAEVLYERAIAIAPEDISLRTALVALTRAQDRPLAAREQIIALQEQLSTRGLLQRQQLLIQEQLLLQRGFQPIWERY